MTRPVRSALGSKIAGLISGVLGLALASSIVATVFSWRLQQLMTGPLTQDLDSVHAAEELEIALLEQRGLVAAYILDQGDPLWLERLEHLQPQFDYWLNQAQLAADSPDEQAIVHQIDLAFQQYDQKREDVVLLYQEGKVDAATQILLGDVNLAYGTVYGECEKYIETNVSLAGETFQWATRRTSRMTVIVGLLVAMTIGLSTILLVLFFRQILFPLRRMLAEVDRFSGIDRDGNSDPPTDELILVGRSLRTLMADVADTRSSLQRSRDRLVQSEKLAMVGRLAASVAHEIRNPLTAMKMWLFSIRRAIPPDQELQEKFDLVSDEMDRLENIVQNFLEFSRSPDHVPAPLDVARLLDRTLELMSHRTAEKGVNVVCQVETGLPAAMADAEQLKQVFINLITNATDAMTGGGEVQVWASATPDEGGNPMVVVRVRDKGGGVPPDVQAHIFEPFFTTKKDGTGLGLCIAAQIMVRHGGRLNLEASGPHGSCFAVWIPAAGEDRHAENPDR